VVQFPGYDHSLRRCALNQQMSRPILREIVPNKGEIYFHVSETVRLRETASGLELLKARLLPNDSGTVTLLVTARKRRIIATGIF
jgi:hypothetical protein